jgi:hypothetical protein
MNQNINKNARMEPWLASGLIILATALTYGILLPKLGFYRDDWYMLWSGQSKDGLSAIIRLFQTDRPLIGWTYAWIFKLIGANVLMWQLLALVLKICTGLAVFWLLRLVWPEKRLETTTAALLFVLYPGFFQQPVAATFCIDLLGLNAIFISIALTVYTLKTSNRVLQILATLAAVALGLINLGLYEATIGLEVVRWALVWLVLQQNKTRQESGSGHQKIIEAGGGEPKTTRFAFTRSALIALVPYLLMLAGYLYWRLFIFKSVRRATNIDVLLADYASNPLYSIVQIVIGFIKDLFETVVLAWFVPFYQFTAEGRFNSFLAALGLALAVLALAGLYLYLFRRLYPDAEKFGQDNHAFLWIGLIGVVIPSTVIVLLGRNVIFSIQWDRYTTQSMLGVGILISALVFKFLRAPARWSVLAVLIVLAVMTQYHSAASYSRFWDYERGVIWQLSWRAPGLQPGTTLIVSLPEGSRLAEEYEIWGPVNMAYYPGQNMQVSGQVPTDDIILDLQAGTLDKRLMRNINIVRDFSKPLIVSLPSGNSCVHFLDGHRLALPFFENGRIMQIARYSNIALINPSAKPITPSAAIFGPEPDRNWCYYYQKIELALQSTNFNEAARLADEAEQKDLKPSDQTEWVPVIEAYAGNDQAKKAAATLKKMDKDLRKYICLQQPDPSLPGPAGLTPLLCSGN